jgi:hypothetical protein
VVGWTVGSVTGTVAGVVVVGGVFSAGLSAVQAAMDRVMAAARSIANHLFIFSSLPFLIKNNFCSFA